MIKRRQLLAATGLAGLGAVLTSGVERAAALGPVGALNWTGTPIGGGASYLDDVDSTPDGTWAVGRTLVDGFSDTRPLALQRTDGAWVATPTPIRTNAVLYSVAVAAADEVWAVGADFTDPRVSKPLVLRWNGRKWRVVRAPAVPSGAFGDVVVGSDGSVWVAGWADVDGIEHAVVYRYARGRWRLLSSGLEQSINGNALLVRSATDAWLALNPGLAHFDGKTWTLVEEFPADGSQIVVGLVAASSNSLWAVGVQHTSSGERPLALRYDGSTWTSVAVPKESAQLYDVAIWHDRPVAVGERFTHESDGTVSNQQYVLEYRNGRYAEAEAPHVPEGPNAVLTGVVAGPSRLWAVGAVDLEAFAAYSG